jgi:putative ABC transport system permease protein
MAARRVVVRWSWRLFRREWRQQLLVLVLLTTTVAGSILGAVAARSLTSASAAEFGSASHFLKISTRDAAQSAAALRALEERFGTIDVIGTRQASVPGSVEAVEYRSQDPEGPYGTPMLAVRAGRYPVGGEVALTRHVADSLQLSIGDHLSLDEVDRPVVGIVENPNDLDDEFALVAPGDPLARSQTILVQASEDQLRALPTEIPVDVIAQRGQDEAATAAVGALSLAVVVAILVCLVAAAGFVVVAQRRLRQLGMLAAIGATERHLRLVVVANGALVGAASAVVGAGLAWVGWIGLSPRLEGVANRRLDRYDVPWWIVAAGMALALVTATAAAWWPGRAVSRVPVTSALSARPPKPRPVHRSALAAAVLVAAGFASLAVGLDVVADEANVVLILPGMAALVVGVLLISPSAIRTLAPLARRSPIAIRLALRDLARHQARSGVALAAITLALGIAVTTVVVAAAGEYGPSEGNLSDRQVLVRFGGAEPFIPDLTAAAIATRQQAVDELAARLDATVIPLQAATSTSALETHDGVAYHPAVVLGRPVGDVTRDIGILYVATPELAHHLGIDLATIDPATDVITPQTGEVEFANTRQHEDPPVTEPFDGPGYSDAPTSLLTPAALERHGWEAIPVGWFLETTAPLAAAQIAAARASADDAGLTIETRDEQASLTSIRTWATVAGMSLALAILAMTVGLIRGEASSEVRTLAATGATSRTRRAIVAATAGALALLGVVIGTAGAYLALIASYLEDLHPLLRSIPTLHLLVTAVGVPSLAAGTGWLLAGREPPLVRAVVE